MRPFLSKPGTYTNAAASFPGRFDTHMPLFQLILIAVIQGITEFLPVSSSGHLILLPNLTSMEDQGAVIDVAVHVGTLFAVILFFWADVKIALQGTGRLLRGKVDTPGAFLALCLGIATVPVILLGLVLHTTGLSEALRSVAVIGWAMLIFGIYLYWADQTGPQDRTADRWSLKHAAIMGLWQAVALIPGTSRSGITISAARQLGYARHGAAKLAMLMSIPTIFASGVVVGTDTVFSADVTTARDGAIAAAFAFVAALLALGIMMRLLRVVLGVILLIIAYT